MKRIVNKCPFYCNGDCINNQIDLRPGFEVCDGNCYEEYDDEKIYNY